MGYRLRYLWISGAILLALLVGALGGAAAESREELWLHRPLFPPTRRPIFD